MYKILDTYPYVNISEIKPNPWNPNIQDDFQMRKLMTSIEEFGFIDPITVREIDEGYEIIDGEHRWRAAQMLGGTVINITNLGIVPDVIAKQLTLLLRLRGQEDDIKLSDLLVDLEGQVGRDHLNKVLPYTPERISMLLDMVNFSPDQYGEFDPNDYWVEYNISIGEDDMNTIMDEFERIGRISEFNHSMTDEIKRGLILERICALSAGLVIDE